MIKEKVEEFIKDACAVDEVSEAAVENVKILFEELSEREERIIRLRYGLDDGRRRSLEEVAREFDVTREQIRQWESKAIMKLRNPFVRKQLASLK